LEVNIEKKRLERKSRYLYINPDQRDECRPFQEQQVDHDACGETYPSENISTSLRTPHRLLDVIRYSRMKRKEEMEEGDPRKIRPDAHASG
jgi:hypothetical protein